MDDTNGDTIVTAENAGPMVDRIMADRAFERSGKAAFAAEHAADLPAELQRQLGDDPAGWASDAERLRLQQRRDAGTATGRDLIALAVMTPPAGDPRGRLAGPAIAEALESDPASVQRRDDAGTASAVDLIARGVAATSADRSGRTLAT